MHTQPAKLLTQQLKQISGIESKATACPSLDEIPITSDQLCIVLDLSGRLNGFFAISLELELASQISFKIINQALEGGFDQEQLDSELTANTIGELINMTLGELFIKEHHQASTYISAPRYSNTKQELVVLESASKHFKVDINGQHCFLSYIIDETKQ